MTDLQTFASHNDAQPLVRKLAAPLILTACGLIQAAWLGFLGWGVYTLAMLVFG
ncbi:hypothetical protein [Alsobacter soli]|uniref:hypothetical protein n=1 Tax=Alsobacter soli TaxID=2109933 RepID=UPI001304D331|nr:hypothetical protein [Alsobacter soli]